MDKQWIKQDFLSDLPLGIVHIILSFVPIRDAIRTSILARKWRYIWASLPRLAFDHECVKPIENVSHEKRLIHFISQTLFLHEGPIHTFELRLFDISMGESHCIDQWLLFLSRNDVKILVLGDGDDDDEDDDFGFDSPSSLYSCQNLTHIKLHVKTIRPPPPSFKGFLFLRSLDVYIDKVSPGTIEIIVALSPLLEKITLECYEDSEMTIRAPNLKYFRFDYAPDHICLCTPLLEEFVGCFIGIKSFSIDVESLVFHHLTTIELSDSWFGTEQVTMDVIRLINGSPNLQKLEISRWEFFKCEASELAFASLWDKNSLKVIKMEGFRRNEMGEMKLLKLLLARSPVLEKMVYKPRSSLSDLELLKLTAQLLRYRRASTNAEIVILDDRVSSSLHLDEAI